MSKGHFVVTSKVSLDNVEVGHTFQTSDYATQTPGGNFVQMKYIEPEEDQKREPTHVKPGVFAMKKSMAGIYLEATEFNKDKVLDSFVETGHIEEKVDKFFNKIDVYRKCGIDNIKRALLVHGRPGTGKTTTINKICNRYAADKETLVLVWHTDIFEPEEVKSFVQSFEYEKHSVKRMILVVEDLGGGTMEGARTRSDSSLLSLLDNKEKTFRVPIFILATTNNIEMFQENIVDRPERFDDIMEAQYPSAEFRVALLKFYAGEDVAVEPEAEELLKSSKCEQTSPAHIRDIIIRSQIYDLKQVDVIKQQLEHSKKYKKAFAKSGDSVGFRG